MKLSYPRSPEGEALLLQGHLLACLATCGPCIQNHDPLSGVEDG